MASASLETAALLAPMISKTLWVVLSTAEVPSAQMEPHAPEHLHYMNDLEARGLVWASGPFIVPGRVVGDGLTIFNVPEETDVHRLMQEEPLAKRAMRTYTVHRWELREGMMAIELHLSQSKFELG
jgi:uncharacterized protein